MRLLPFLVLAIACGGDEATDERVDAILALDGDVAAGEALYPNQCENCHGPDGEGVTGPALDGSPDAYSDEQMAILLLDGQGDMPAHDYLSDQEIADLMAYVYATW